MLVKKFLKVLLLLLGGIYILFQGLALELEGAALSAVILILLIWLYMGWTEHKTRLFFWFLISFTAAHVLSVIAWYTPQIQPGETDYYYFVANILYIISYALLIIKIIKNLNLKKVFAELTIPIIILVILDVFCVTLISDTVNSFSYEQYIVEYVYNAIIMTLLSFALINYMYRNNNKSMLFLIGSIFIVFSEIIQLAYYYILSDDNLGFVYSFFMVIAFVFYYMQSQHVVSEPVAAYIDEPIEA